MKLTKEVLPPRQVPSYDPCAFVVEETRQRQAIARSILTVGIAFALANIVMRMLEGL